MWQSAHHDYSSWDTGANAGLVYNNSMFDLIRSKNTVSLVHVTSSLDDIVESGQLYPSAGCLVGSIYCTPAYAAPDEQRLRLHNLGGYYFLREVPRAISSSSQMDGKVPAILIIEVERHGNAGYGIEGVNYLRMGRIHYDIFHRDDLSFLLSQDERQWLRRHVLQSVQYESGFLLDCVRQHVAGEKSEEANIDFLARASSAVKNIPYLGYVLFESFGLTMMLLQDDMFSQRCRSLGEFNNWNYKEIMYEMFPGFADKFKLGEFSPDWSELVKCVLQHNVLPNISRERFIYSVARRARKYICDNMFVDYKSLAHGQNEGNSTWSWENQNLVPLLGHMIHRQLRKTDAQDRYIQFFKFFEQTKATQIWAYWNKKDIALPFNGVLPKGEIGLNPCFDRMSVQCFEGAVDEVVDNTVFLRKGRKVRASVATELGSPRHAFRRDRFSEFDR